MKYLAHDPSRVAFRRMETGTCIACLKAVARSSAQPASDFCRYHLNAWDLKRQHYERRRLTGACVYCGAPATFHRVHCVSDDCTTLHEQNIDIVLERLAILAPPHNLAHRRSVMRRHGIAYHYYEEGVCQLT